MCGPDCLPPLTRESFIPLKICALPNCNSIPDAGFSELLVFIYPSELESKETTSFILNSTLGNIIQDSYSMHSMSTATCNIPLSELSYMHGVHFSTDMLCQSSPTCIKYVLTDTLWQSSPACIVYQHGLMSHMVIKHRLLKQLKKQPRKEGMRNLYHSNLVLQLVSYRLPSPLVCQSSSHSTKL